METLYTFLYSYGVGQTFTYNTAAILLGMGSYKFWKVSSGILPFFLKDIQVAWEILQVFLTPVPRTEYSSSVMFKSGDYTGMLATEDVEAHLHDL
jgi:hypothetical protein